MGTEGSKSGVNWAVASGAVLLPLDEARRLAELRRYRILDTPPEPVFDDLVRLAAQICGTPTAVVSLVDKHRSWFKAVIGGNVPEKPRQETFCPHCIVERSAVIVPDALEDARFCQLACVTGAPYIRFYAGYPLETRRGLVLGALCVMDQTPRTMTPEQDAAMRTLVGRVVSELELRRTALELQDLRNREREIEHRLLDLRALESLRFGADLHRSVTEEVARVSRALQALSQPDGPGGQDALGRQWLASLYPQLECAVAACNALASRLTEGILLQEGWVSALEASLRNLGPDVAARCLIECHADPEEHLAFANVYHLYEIARISARAALARSSTAQAQVAVATLGPSVLLQVDGTLTGVAAEPLLPGSVDHTTVAYHASCLDAQLDIQSDGQGNFVVRCVVPRSALH